MVVCGTGYVVRTTKSGVIIMLRNKKKGQTAVEFTVLIIVAIGAFLGIQNYVKRGIQGRWRDAVDGLGDQYDPRTADTQLRHTISSSTNTLIKTYNTQGGFWTRRTDDSFSSEKKTGYTGSGAY